MASVKIDGSSRGKQNPRLLGSELKSFEVRKKLALSAVVMIKYNP